MTDLIALNKLVASRDNARKTGIADGLEELAASIAAHGLLQSLVVRKTSRGKFAVIAGQRRRMALSMLAEKGSIPSDMPIPCTVLSKEADAAEISLAENVVRVPMHPADQFEAFRSLRPQVSRQNRLRWLREQMMASRQVIEQMFGSYPMTTDRFVGRGDLNAFVRPKIMTRVSV